MLIRVLTDAKLSNKLILKKVHAEPAGPSEGIPGENAAHTTPQVHQWEIPADTVLATDIDAESGDEREILRITDAVIGFTSAFERISFSDEDRRRGVALFCIVSQH